MADFNPIQIPPHSIGPVDPTSGQGAKPKQAEGSPGFQDILKEQLGEISRETDQVANVSNPTFEDMAKVMSAAKSVFDDTMNAHQLMQQMINHLPEDSAPTENPQENTK
jgi:hypothetical protein